jgi:hypothetical protein
MSSLELLHISLENQISILEATLETTSNLAIGLDKLSLPVEKLAVPNFDDAVAYRESPFRNIQFKFKKVPGVQHAFLEAQKGKVVSYDKLCEFVRSYIDAHGLRLPGGLIRCDAFLKQITDTDTVSFFGLLQKFNRIIQ